MATVQARSSDAFVESMGINWSYVDSFIGHYGLTAAANICADLGIRYLRTRILDSTLHAASINAATKNSAMVNGVRIMVSMGDAPNYGSMSAWVTQLAHEVTAYPGAIIGVEGDNEPDNVGGQSQMNTSIADMIAYGTARAGTSAATIPLLTPPLAAEGGGGLTAKNFFTSGGANQNIPQNYNIISGHWGYVGQQPEIGGWFSNAVPNLVTPLQYGSNNLPIWITEGGNPSTSAGDANTQPFATQAVWLPRQFMYYWVNGVARFFKYDFFQYPDGSTLGYENTYSIVNYFGDDADPAPVLPYTGTTAKPVYFALKNLIRLMTDPAPAAGVDSFVPGTLTYTLSGATFSGPTGIAIATSGSNWNVYHTVHGKRDGSFIICLWQYQTVNNGTFNGDGHGRIAPPSTIAVTINVPNMGQYQTATLSTTPTMNTFSTAASIPSNQNVVVNVNDDLTFVRLIPTVVSSAPGSVTATQGTVTATEATITWSGASNSPSDYVITVTELT